MIAGATRARQWRAALLALLLFFLALLIALAVLDEQPPLDRLPLRGVPEAEYARTGITLAPAYDEQAAMDSRGAEFLAKELVRRGTIRQIVLVRLKRVDSGNPGILTYAINYDTRTAPDFPCLGGPGNCPRVEIHRDLDHFVMFLDASSGAHVYSLFPRSEYPFPEPESQQSLVLYGVPPEHLAASDVVLKKPPADSVPQVSEDVARSYVIRRFPGASVRQVVLGQLTESLGEWPPIYEKLVWVVSLEPDSLSAPVAPALASRGSGSSNATRFALVFVDANTAEFVYFLSR